MKKKDVERNGKNNNNTKATTDKLNIIIIIFLAVTAQCSFFLK